MEQISRGAITVTELKNCICVSIGDDLTSKETEIVVNALHVDYIPDLIAALKAYKQSKRNHHESRN